MLAEINGNLAKDPKLVTTSTGSQYLYLTLIEDFINQGTGKQDGIDVFVARLWSDGKNPSAAFMVAQNLKKGDRVKAKGRYHRRPSKDENGNPNGYFEYLSITQLTAQVYTQKKERVA